MSRVLGSRSARGFWLACVGSPISPMKRLIGIHNGIELENDAISRPEVGRQLEVVAGIRKRSLSRTASGGILGKEPRLGMFAIATSLACTPACA